MASTNTAGIEMEQPEQIIFPHEIEDQEEKRAEHARRIIRFHAQHFTPEQIAAAFLAATTQISGG
jgi:hypothetical protein